MGISVPPVHGVYYGGWRDNDRNGDDLLLTNGRYVGRLRGGIKPDKLYYARKSYYL